MMMMKKGRGNREADERAVGNEGSSNVRREGRMA
jgi:hypothetical protein